MRTNPRLWIGSGAALVSLLGFVLVGYLISVQISGGSILSLRAEEVRSQTGIVKLADDLRVLLYDMTAGVRDIRLAGSASELHAVETDLAARQQAAKAAIDALLAGGGSEEQRQRLANLKDTVDRYVDAVGKPLAALRGEQLMARATDSGGVSSARAAAIDLEIARIVAENGGPVRSALERLMQRAVQFEQHRMHDVSGATVRDVRAMETRIVAASLGLGLLITLVWVGGIMMIWRSGDALDGRAARPANDNPVGALADARVGISLSGPVDPLPPRAPAAAAPDLPDGFQASFDALIRMATSAARSKAGAHGGSGAGGRRPVRGRLHS